jgi:hypothetical protein
VTSIGHTLTGMSLAVLTVRETGTPWWRRPAFHIFALAANIPDLPLPGWGHDLYHVSHSVFVTLALLVVFESPFYASRKLRAQAGGPRAFVGFSLAWLSHLLLDSFYSHGRGIAIFWPISGAHLALPIPWFHTIRLHPWDTSFNLSVFLVELAFYGPFLAFCIYLRRRVSANRPQ